VKHAAAILVALAVASCGEVYVTNYDDAVHPDVRSILDATGWSGHVRGNVGWIIWLDDTAPDPCPYTDDGLQPWGCAWVGNFGRPKTAVKTGLASHLEALVLVHEAAHHGECGIGDGTEDCASVAGTAFLDDYYKTLH
jgi:hypothetical protein